MGSNSFGRAFKITTWGESHGKAVGVVIDGCPAGLYLDESQINSELEKRRGGTRYTTPRREDDKIEILSGVFEGKTTGAPLSLICYNKEHDSTKYEPIKEILRPGHANFTYQEKYGIFDHRGGGRASARETVCRVAAGAVAKRLLIERGIYPLTFIWQIGNISMEEQEPITAELIHKSPIFCPDPKASMAMEEALDSAMQSNDSLGGVIECRFMNVPAGLGDPVYEKLPSNMAKAILSIPACKGIEFGSGFLSSKMRGSSNNDLFTHGPNGAISTMTNHAGGTLGGITNGMPLIFKVAMKPTSSIKKIQPSLTTKGSACSLTLPEGSRHDPCVAIRAVSVVEAMASIVIADALLMDRLAKI